MGYLRCPKCGHAPLPPDQAMPAACPACGLVLAKYGAAVPRAKPPAPDAVAGLLSAYILHVPDQVPRLEWQGRAGLLAIFAAWTLWILAGTSIARGEGGSYFLHSVLLPFHEAGHYLIFRWFGQFIMTLGGALGQLGMPIVVGYALLVQRRDPYGAALCFWLLGFSTADTAIYMYDAFDPKLMLLGGKTGAESDGHDWQNLFGDMGLLKRARGIGMFFGVLGMAMMLAGLAWAGWVLKLQRPRLSDSASTMQE
jgi:hypothetical protein